MFWIIFLIGCLGLTGILWLRRLTLLFHVVGLSLRDVSEILLGRVLENGSIGSPRYSL
jgi:hypothetical protein